MPLIVQSTKQHTTSFNLSIIKSHMQTATNNKATLAETKVAIVHMYQNGTTAKLSPQAQKAAHALAQYIYVNKESKKFAFVLGKDHQGQQLLLLTIANHPATSQANASLQRSIRQAPSSTQKQDVISSVKQLSWVTSVLQQAEFGILFWIYHNRLSGQEAMLGTTLVPAPIKAVNFQRVKTSHEQLQDQAWAKMIEVVQNLTSRQLKISTNAQQLPSQTKITASNIELALQNIISNHDDISKAAQKLIKVDHIEVELNDKYGKIMITIKNYGPNKIITIFGYKATATPLEVAQAKIDAAQDVVNLPTTLNKVFHGQMPIALDVHVPTKKGVTFKFKEATAVNNEGASTLTYEVDADPHVDGAILQDVTFIVSGFETQVQAAERLAQAAIQQLEPSDFTTGIDKDQIASASKPNKAHVISDIKKQINDEDAQALIVPGDITITANSIARTITIVILHHGPSKTITIPKFKLISIKDYLDQLLNAIPSAGGTLAIPEGITSSQFDVYVQAMGNVLNEHNAIIENKFAKSYKTKITSLIIPHSFTTIGSWFWHFDKITSLRIPNSVITILDNAFSNSPLTTLSLGDQLQIIGKFAFSNAQLSSLIIPNSVTVIDNTAFDSSPLTSLSLGNHLQTIGNYAFQSALLKTLTIPDAVTAIGTRAFELSPLTTLSLGNQLQTIDSGAFKSAQLTSLIIPDSVTTIGSFAFANSPLGTINIFEGVKLVGSPFKSGVTINRPIRPT